MPLPSAEQVFQFAKDLALPVIIMGVGLWYLSDLIEKQDTKQTENASFIRDQLMSMNNKSFELLSKTNQAIDRNTIAFEKQNMFSDAITKSVIRQEVTLDSIDTTLENACKLNEATQVYLEAFSKKVLEDHPEQLELLKKIDGKINQ